jgi:hypothetical protein
LATKRRNTSRNLRYPINTSGDLKVQRITDIKKMERFFTHYCQQMANAKPKGKKVLRAQITRLNRLINKHKYPSEKPSQKK